MATPTLFDAETRAEMLDRLSKITPDSGRTFGSMTPGEMICHMKDCFEIGLAEKPATRDMPMGLIFGFPPIRSYIINKMAWPKGKLASPANQMETKPTGFDSDKEKFVAVVNRFGERGPGGADGGFGTHAVFGKMDGAMWGALLTKHLNHHLEQFGV